MILRVVAATMPKLFAHIFTTKFGASCLQLEHGFFVEQ